MKERFEIIIPDEVLDFFEQLDERTSEKITYHYIKFNAMGNTRKDKYHTLSEVEDRIIGPKGTYRRDKYEYELQIDILA